ncbi:hypothetical protein MRX96_026071 [Rhipicephalus microplus]
MPPCQRSPFSRTTYRRLPENAQGEEHPVICRRFEIRCRRTAASSSSCQLLSEARRRHRLQAAVENGRASLLEVRYTLPHHGTDIARKTLSRCKKGMTGKGYAGRVSCSEEARASYDGEQLSAPSSSAD